MAQSQYEQIIDALPPGLDRAVLRVLNFHQGREKAISRGQLVHDLAQSGFRVHERAARACISQLRKAGHLIGSAPGEDGGYYLLTTLEEFEEFVRDEYLAKINDMHETLVAMQKAAKETWKMAGQERMF